MIGTLDRDEIIDMIGDMTYKPSWRISARPYDQIVNAVVVTFEYTVPNASREYAPDFEVMTDARVEFVLVCKGCPRLEVQRQVMHFILRIEEHEAREFMRFGEEMHAPFHPHHPDGMAAWGDEYRDITFGKV